MFTLKELEEDPTATLDLKEDIREECEKLGDVTNVVLYDKEEDGIVSVRFANAESAKACVGVCSPPSTSETNLQAHGVDTPGNRLWMAASLRGRR
jgi:HIV Tat-specific factor 1